MSHTCTELQPPGVCFRCDLNRDEAKDDLAAILEHVSVRAWCCPIEGHSFGGPLRPTVEWRDNVAYCLEPGCGRTSEKPDG